MNKPQHEQDDEAIWQEFVRDIPPLSKENIFHTKVRNLKVNPHINYESVYSGNNLSEIRADIATDMDKNTAQKFKQGKFPIEARLDLHGFTEKEAWLAVNEFVKKSYMDKKRCVIIITGKGKHASENDDIFSSQGVLKEQLPKWLNNQELRPLILACSEALPRDGGSGAFYILLRRHRN